MQVEKNIGEFSRWGRDSCKMGRTLRSLVDGEETVVRWEEL